MPSIDQHHLVRLAGATDPVQADIRQKALEQEGILFRVLCDYLDAGRGDILGFAAEVSVKPAELAGAEAMLGQQLSEDAAEPEERRISEL
jgi:hypothetical protein